jgi:hypothetical protein
MTITPDSRDVEIRSKCGYNRDAVNRLLEGRRYDRELSSKPAECERLRSGSSKAPDQYGVSMKAWRIAPGKTAAFRERLQYLFGHRRFDAFGDHKARVEARRCSR